MFRTRVIQQRLSLKIIVFVEMPCWSPSPSGGLQHGGRKPVETSLEFTLALSKCLLFLLKLENIRIGTSLKILVTQNSKHKAIRGIETFPTRNMLPRNNADVTHCERTGAPSKLTPTYYVFPL